MTLAQTKTGLTIDQLSGVKNQVNTGSIIESQYATLETTDILYINECIDDPSLNHASLRKQDLRRVNFKATQLNFADLRESDLREANLSDSFLNFADLRGADLRGANIKGADLRGVNLTGADLSGANLNNTIFTSTGQCKLTDYCCGVISN